MIRGRLLIAAALLAAAFAQATAGQGAAARRARPSAAAQGTAAKAAAAQGTAAGAVVEKPDGDARRDETPRAGWTGFYGGLNGGASRALDP